MNDICCYFNDDDLASLSWTNRNYEKMLEPVLKRRYEEYETVNEIISNDLHQYAKFFNIEEKHIRFSIFKLDAINIFKYKFSPNKISASFLELASSLGSYKISKYILKHNNFSLEEMTRCCESALKNMDCYDTCEKVIESIVDSGQPYDIDVKKYRESMSKLDSSLCLDILKNNLNPSSIDFRACVVSTILSINKISTDVPMLQNAANFINHLPYESLNNTMEIFLPDKISLVNIYFMLFLSALHSNPNFYLCSFFVMGLYFYQGFYKRKFYDHCCVMDGVAHGINNNQHNPATYLSHAKQYCLPILIGGLALCYRKSFIPLIISCWSYLLLHNYGTQMLKNLANVTPKFIQSSIFYCARYCDIMNPLLYKYVAIILYGLLPIYVRSCELFVYVVIRHKLYGKGFFICILIIIQLLTLYLLPMHLIIIGYSLVRTAYMKSMKLSFIDILTFTLIVISHYVNINVALIVTAFVALFSEISQVAPKQNKITRIVDYQ
jgi:hypothetical protein